MKKLILFFFAIMLFSSLSAQETDSNITVKSLTELSNDTEASVARKLDSRDKKCALIKVRTPNLNAEERGKFSFQGDAGTEVFPEKATGELKLYLTEGAKRLRIMHDDYGVVEYSIQIPIVGFRTYKMEIVVDKGAVAAAAVPATGLSANYVEINVEPSDATVLIDDNPVTDGTAYLEIDVDHTLTVSKAMYHTHTQIIRANKNKKMVYDVKLTPAFGWLRIVSQPEGGATVFVDGMEKGKTPLTTAKLESGEHTIRLIKEMFEPLEKTVNVRDNDTATVTLKMKGNFAEVTVNIADQKAEIYVDGKKKSDGTWNGRLSAGTHLVEARRQYHTSTMKEITCAVGVPQTITIDSPKPIIGSMNIKSNPSKAKIYLDGKDLERTTPDIIQDVYAGEHRLKIEKEGYSTYNETVIVKENEMTSIEVELASTKEVTITTDKAGDKIYVNGNYVGTSPVKTTVNYGEINVTVERDNDDSMKEDKIVKIASDTPNEIKLKFGTEVLIISRVGPYKSINEGKIQKYDEIYVDGKSVGRASYKGFGSAKLKCTLSKGEHLIEAKSMYKRHGKKRVIISDSSDVVNLFAKSVFADVSFGTIQCANATGINPFVSVNVDVKLFSSFLSVALSPGFDCFFLYFSGEDGYDYHTSCYEIPAIAKLQLGTNESWCLWIGGGCKLSVCGNINYRSSSSRASTSSYEKMDLSNKDKISWNFVWGGGILFGPISFDIYNRNIVLPSAENSTNTINCWEYRMSMKLRMLH